MIVNCPSLYQLLCQTVRQSTVLNQSVLVYIFVSMLHNNILIKKLCIQSLGDLLSQLKLQNKTNEFCVNIAAEVSGDERLFFLTLLYRAARRPSGGFCSCLYEP